MAETSFEVRYEGVALRDGRMPVRDLAPALMALGEVFRQAGMTLHPDLPPPTLEINATDRGSFVVDLILSAPDVWNQSVDMLVAEGSTALSNLESLVIGGYGVFKLTQKLHGRRIKSVEPTEDPDVMRIVVDDETVIETAAGTVKLYRSPPVRRAARDSISPVKQPGMERVEFRSAHDLDDPPLVIEEDDVPAFDLALDDVQEDELVDDSRTVVVQLVKTDFEDGRWKVNDGSATFGVEMDDQGFKDRIDKGEPFRKGDLFRCRIRTIQSTRDGKLQTVNRIVEVIEHIKRGEQLEMEAPSSVRFDLKVPDPRALPPPGEDDDAEPQG